MPTYQSGSPCKRTSNANTILRPLKRQHNLQPICAWQFFMSLVNCYALLYTYIDVGILDFAAFLGPIALKLSYANSTQSVNTWIFITSHQELLIVDGYVTLPRLYKSTTVVSAYPLITMIAGSWSSSGIFQCRQWSPRRKQT